MITARRAAILVFMLVLLGAAAFWVLQLRSQTRNPAQDGVNLSKAGKYLEAREELLPYASLHACNHLAFIGLSHVFANSPRVDPTRAGIYSILGRCATNDCRHCGAGHILYDAAQQILSTPENSMSEDVLAQAGPLMVRAAELADVRAIECLATQRSRCAKFVNEARATYWRQLWNELNRHVEVME